MAVNINLGGWTVQKNILRSGSGLNTVGLISNDDHTRISEGNWLGEDGFEYVTLEYLENRGGSYINLGIPFNPTKDGFKIVAESFSTTRNMMPFGSGSSDHTQYRCWLYYYPGGTGKIDFYTQTKLNKTYGLVSLDKMEFTFDPDSTETDVDYPDMCLFNAYTKAYAFKGRIYSCIITKDGTVYRNLSPVRRYNANTEKVEYGMYDSISQSFFGDATDRNDFTGPRKLSDVYSFYTEVDLMGGYTYRELEYIESTGQQFIDTGVTFARDDSLKVELDIDILDREASTWGQLFGVSINASGELTNSGPPFSLWINHGGTTGPTLDKYIGSNHESTPMTFGRQKIVMEANSLAYGSNNPLYIFAIDYSGTPSYHKCPYKLYSCVIYKNGVKERDYIPVARTKTNSAPIYDYGVYDIIDSHRKFYRNIGYDNFIPGAVADVNRLLQKRTTYRRLEYIESEGIDYVDSGFKITSSTKVNAVVAAGAENTGYRFLFGAWSTLALGYNQNIWTACAGKFYKANCGEVEKDKKISVSLDPVVGLEEGAEAWVDGRGYSLLDPGSENNYNFLIFGSSDSGLGPHSWDSPYHGTGRIYQLEVINDADGKDHLFIPVKTGDGKLGFYDSYQMEFLPLPDGAQGFSGHDLPVGTEFVSIYCGDTNPEDAPFRVTNRGNLYAENATIKGHVEAQTGYIGELDISNGGLERKIDGVTSYSINDAGITFGNESKLTVGSTELSYENNETRFSSFGNPIVISSGKSDESSYLKIDNDDKSSPINIENCGYTIIVQPYFENRSSGNYYRMNVIIRLEVPKEVCESIFADSGQFYTGVKPVLEVFNYNNVGVESKEFSISTFTITRTGSTTQERYYIQFYNPSTPSISYRHTITLGGGATGFEKRMFLSFVSTDNPTKTVERFEIGHMDGGLFGPLPGGGTREELSYIYLYPATHDYGISKQIFPNSEDARDITLIESTTKAEIYFDIRRIQSEIYAFCPDLQGHWGPPPSGTLPYLQRYPLWYFGQTPLPGTIKMKGDFLPKDDGAYDLGEDSPIRTLRWRTIYVTTGPSTTSFRGAKTDIESLNEKNDILFDNLLPRTYKLKKNESDRTHYGFILDEVRSAMDQAEIEPKDFAAYTLANPDNPDGDGGLRYSEFIPLNTWQIQKLKSRCAELESKVESLIAQIEELKTKNE